MRPKIYLVCLMPTKRHWTGQASPAQLKDRIAVFRDGPLYKEYLYRAGLRHQRLMRIIGRRAT